MRLGLFSRIRSTQVILKVLTCTELKMKGLRLNICLTLTVMLFLADNGFGAPTKGRYMWVTCRPNSKNSNCVTQRGPTLKLPGPPDRLPPTAVRDIMQEQTVSEPEEQSGEGSATELDYADQGSGNQLGSQTVDGLDYSGYVYPQMAPKNQDLPPAQELKEDHLIV